MLAQVANRFCANTTGPDIPIGSDLCGCHPSHARNNLALLSQCALHNIVVTITKCLRDARNTIELSFVNAFLQALDDRLITLNWRCDGHSYCIPFIAPFSIFTDECVRPAFLTSKGINSV